MVRCDTRWQLGRNQRPVGPAAERARLQKEQAELQALLARTRATLANADYLAKAPPKLVSDGGPNHLATRTRPALQAASSPSTDSSGGAIR